MALARNERLIILRNSVGWVLSSCVPANSGMFSSCIGRHTETGCGLGKGGMRVLIGGGGMLESTKGFTYSELFSDGY